MVRATLRGSGEPPVAGFVRDTVGLMKIAVGATLPSHLLDAKVSGSDGSVHAFRDVLEPGTTPTLVVFVRQFGCAGCGLRTTELLGQIETLRDARTRVILVGCGTAADAAQFRETFDLGSRPIALVTDPTLRVHVAAGLLHSYWGVLGPSGTAALVKAMLAGQRNAWGHGDFYQLGGTILLDAKGEVHTHHVERFLGDTLPFTELVDAALAMRLVAARDRGVLLP